MRLRGFGLGRVGMEKLKNSHKGGWCANFAHRKGGASFAQGEGIVRISYKWRGSANFAQCTIHPCKCEIGFFQMAKSFGF